MSYPGQYQYTVRDDGDCFTVVSHLATPGGPCPESVSVPKDHPRLIAACLAAGIELPGVPPR